MTAEHPWAPAVGPVWVEIDLDAIADNVRAVRGHLPEGCRLLAVVKADGYGHGALQVARVMLETGAHGLGVSTVPEGLSLRRSGVRAPILVLTPPRPTDLEAALDAALTTVVVDLEGARALDASAKGRPRRAVAHVKCDTGMGRYGFDHASLGRVAPELRAMDGVEWEGVFTHFRRGADAAASRVQLDRLLAAVEDARGAGLTFAVRHAAASAAVLSLPAACLDMVRVGTLLYGRAPETVGLRLRPAFALRAEPAQLRELGPGTAVGYGGEWRARRPTSVAVLPVGYADGLDMAPMGPYRRPRTLLRALARWLLTRLGLGARLGPGIGAIEIGGHQVPLLGRVGMQQVTVDCSRLPPELRRLPATVHVQPTAVSAHVPRVYSRDGRTVAATTLLGTLEGELRARATTR